jgi:SPP1 gp7 family putative phage head morphogenesis protein
VSAAARRRELARQNRLLVRQEALLQRDVAAMIRRMANVIADRLTYGSDDAAVQIVEDHRAELERILAKRLKQTALIFGGRLLDGVEARAKGFGPVRGLGFVALEWKGMRDIFESAIFQWVAEHALKRARTITDTLKESVRSIVRDSFADGTGEAATAKLIREKVGRQLSASSAARIARTEAHTAAAVGSDQAARSTGLEMVKEWAAAEDSRTRPSHNEADGQEVAMDDAFNVGGAALQFPGDPNAPAREIVNCRCVPLYHPRFGGEIFR